MFPDASTVIRELICPATKKSILKYTEQEKVYIEETPEMYSAVTKPFIDSIPESYIQWVYNILDGSKELENRLLVHSIEEYKNNAYILMKDIKFNEGDIK